MLVLSRYRDENIMIGDDIVVTVVEIFGDKVRLGITCPREIPVDREEIRIAKKLDKRLDDYDDKSYNDASRNRG